MAGSEDHVALGEMENRIKEQLTLFADRLADAFRFGVPGSKTFEAGAKFLLRRGYR